MTQKVSVATADGLAAAFYPRLREHGQPDLALVEAGAALAGRHDITAPALYSRLGGLPLFSDALDRELTAAEIEYGLAAVWRAVAGAGAGTGGQVRRGSDALRSMSAADASALSRQSRQRAEHAPWRASNSL